MDTMPPLTGRSLRILAALVREYIETGEPVGSHALVRAGGFEVSPATMRNELARLESLGYVHQPHTSAGRVPSDLGYRAYVDLLLQSRPARRRTAPALEADLRERAGGAALMDDVLSYVSHVVSQASRHVGFALGPLHQGAAFHQIEFVPLAGSAVLAVIVARGGQICQRVVDLGHDLGATHLAEAASYLNRAFAGLTLAELRERLAEPAENAAHQDPPARRALRLARAAFEDLPAEHPIYIEGAASLLDESRVPGGLSIGTTRALLQMVEEKHRLVRLLSTCLAGPGLNVVIGREHGTPDLREVAIVSSTYSDGQRVGGVGIIGPVRMRYGRAITLVDSVARAVSRVLRDSNWSDDTTSRC